MSKEEIEKKKIVKELAEEAGLMEKEVSEEEVKKIIKKNHSKIKDVLRKYCDIDEKYYNIIALWIIGTYLHKNFQTYPYLYFNAMKGSGKSRVLKLIAYLSKNGEVLGDLKEAVLFRTAANSTFCIDEFENIGKKEKRTLRELLNAAYKKGMSVKRAFKYIDKTREGQSIEKFDVYCPIVMANIFGIQDVLADRCVSIILEKSTTPKITKLMEIFDQDKEILRIKQEFGVVDNYTSTFFKLIEYWNDFVIEYYNPTTTHNNTHTYSTHNNTYTHPYKKLFERIIKTPLDGRHLELFFPLFIISHFCEENVLEETIATAEDLVQQKKAEDVIESKDVALIDFLSKQEDVSDWTPIRDLTKDFKEFLEEGEEDAKWTNYRWIGQALKRLGLTLKKRRVRRGVEVILNYKKAQEKIKMFKEVDPEQKPSKKSKSESQAHLETPQTPKNARIFTFIRNCPEIQLTSGKFPAKLKGDVLNLEEFGSDKEQALRALITQGYVREDEK